MPLLIKSTTPRHRKTRLLHRPDSKHIGVNPQTSVMIGLSPSARKSHLTQRTNKWLTKAAPADEHNEVAAIRSKECFAQEYTPKGFRTCLLNFHRVALYSDECVNIIKTSHADPQALRHYADRAKLNTYLLAEADDMTKPQVRSTSATMTRCMWFP